jgi:hypothetical protein
VVTTGERKPWHAIFRLLERDERVFAVLLAVAMVGGWPPSVWSRSGPASASTSTRSSSGSPSTSRHLRAGHGASARHARHLLGALGIDLLLVFVLLFLTGGGDSLFYLLFFPLVAVNSYYFGPWLGLAAALIAGGLYAAAAALATPWVGWTPVTILAVLFGLPAVTVGIVAVR